MKNSDTMPFFYVLTTTYNRPDLLLRNILSVQNQTYHSFQHVIANDSESTSSYETIRDILQQNTIHYIENTVNKGKNETLNNLLSYVAKQKNVSHSFVVYVDDDDWLHPHALEDFVKAIHENHRKWIVSTRAFVNGSVITKNNTNKTILSYQRDYLLLKKFKGDATHCIASSIAIQGHYPQIQKNGEEWIYFTQIDLLTRGFLFLNKIGTFTDGYSMEGITKNYKTPLLKNLLREVIKYNITTLPVIIYLLLRETKRILLSIRNFK